MNIGDRVKMIPETFGDSTEEREHGIIKKTKRTYEGTVVYVHPEGRFYTVEFDVGKIRESFIMR